MIDNSDAAYACRARCCLPEQSTGHMPALLAAIHPALLRSAAWHIASPVYSLHTPPYPSHCIKHKCQLTGSIATLSHSSAHCHFQDCAKHKYSPPNHAPLIKTNLLTLLLHLHARALDPCMPSTLPSGTVTACAHWCRHACALDRALAPAAYPPQAHFFLVPPCNWHHAICTPPKPHNVESLFSLSLPPVQTGTPTLT